MKPILFNSEMVRAILEGRKTVTRRVVKPQPHGKMSPMPMVDEWPNYWRDESPDRLFTPPYHPGDILYVRETWAKIRTPGDGERYVYEATDQYPFGESYVVKFRWRPSIHMPREAARIFLRVKDVRVERVQDSFSEPISPIFELLAEGIDIGDDCRECIEAYGNPCCVDTDDEDGSNMYGGECGLLDDIRGDFSDLWDSTIKPKDREKYGWAANPYVWVIEFERISREEARHDD